MNDAQKLQLVVGKCASAVLKIHADHSKSAPMLTRQACLSLPPHSCVQKASELILHGRLMPLPASLKPGSVNRWFNIESEELLTMHDELEAWRQDISQPLQIDVFVDAAHGPLIRGTLGMQVRAA